MRPKKFVFSAAIVCGFLTFFSPLRTYAQQQNPLPAAPAPADGQLNSLALQARPVGKAGQPVPGTGDVSGTVTDAYGDVVPGATVSIEGTKPSNHQTQQANDNGFFEFKNVAIGDLYRVTVQANGFEPWTSEMVSLSPGQYVDVTGIKLKLKGETSSITVVADPIEIATEQVHLEEQQRVFGIIPNFYVVYDSKNAAPLSTKLKFQMALRVSVDPVSVIGAGALAGMNQAGNTPNYQQGWKGYGQRFGASYADGVTDIMFGGAILPTIFHQDPRYFYQGTGTVKSRMIHALSNPFICRGDNGKNQINISSMGGDLISASLSNTYYPNSNRGPSLVFGGFLLSTGEREISSVVQEFVLRKLTPSAKR